MKVSLVGVTGYSGMALYHLLSQHPQVEQILLFGHQATTTDEARQLAEEVPAYQNINAQLLPFDPQVVEGQTDVIFFATPAGVTSQIAQPFIEDNFPVIDLSGDYRLKDPVQYQKWYHKAPAVSDSLQKASYNLADLSKPTSNYVANPGCYATATLLGLAPLVINQLIDPDSIIVDAKSGLSGAGKKLTESSHYAYINENMLPYKVNHHQHIPEISQQLHQWDEQVHGLQFTTTLVPMTRGILASIYAKAAQPTSTEELQKLYQDFYADHPWVRVYADGYPSVKNVSHSNYCDVGISYNEANNTIFIGSVIDNLVKGAAGQAMQNMNHLFNFDETMGFTLLPDIP